MVKADVDADELFVEFEVLVMDMDGDLVVEWLDAGLSAVVVDAVPFISMHMEPLKSWL